MDHIGVVKDAWHITWRHKVLWIFGLFASFATGGGVAVAAAAVAVVGAARRTSGPSPMKRPVRSTGCRAT
jgi:hypothetical protein